VPPDGGPVTLAGGSPGPGPAAGPRNLLRPPGPAARVTNIELFFDLVYVFAVTQLSHYLIREPTWAGGARALLLFAMVWLAWAYTTWVTNWLDPGRIPVRVMLLALALISLVMSAGLPAAFGGWGLAVGAAYAVMQTGRSAFAVAGLRGAALQRNFQRILAWCVASGALAVAGGLVAGHARELLWLAAVAVDILGGLAGFWTPGLGRSTTRDWTIEGNHFAERCQAFLLIALGESIVITGARLSENPVTPARAAAFLAAFAGSAGLWWLYFHRSAEESAAVVASSADPGRLGRSAYHLIHPVMVAGIIAVAAGDQITLDRPGQAGLAPVAVMLLGGTALFLAGHAAFKWVIWGRLAWTRLAGIAALAVAAVAVPFGPALLISVLAALAVLAVAVADLLLPAGNPEPARSAS
jgi:low temperature requirement protein LtrA